jgi:long-chain acyl-CoA synthetase
MDLESGTRELPPGEIGELVVRGPQVMKGYWNMPDETEKVLRNGWLYTGDMAKMDEEGYFQIVDRKKDMIIASGYNIYPRDVEEVLYKHPKVIEVVVAGIPNSYRGETVKAYCVLKEGESATEKEIIDFCRGKMAKYKVPTAVEFRKELPKTMVGKILRRMLVEEEKQKTAQQAK